VKQIGTGMALFTELLEVYIRQRKKSRLRPGEEGGTKQKACLDRQAKNHVPFG
jgi:hypothetical protein